MNAAKIGMVCREVSYIQTTGKIKSRLAQRLTIKKNFDMMHLYDKNFD